MKKILLLIIIFGVLMTCKESTNNTQNSILSYVPPQNPLFSILSPQETGISFTNQATDGEKFNILTYRNFYNGSGVAIGDLNNDGLAEVFFTSNMGDNKLFLNKGTFKFEDISTKAGIAGKQAWSTGVAMADVNADGFLDIYVCNSGDVAGDGRENELFINQGNLTFKEQAAAYGLNDKGFSTHASFFDYDLDGDLDCYVLNNSFRDVRKFDIQKESREVRDAEGGDKLYKNDNGKFKDVSEEANIYGSRIGFGLGISVADLNGDMYPDIYISNDFFERDYLYINQKNGTFKEELTQQIGHTSLYSMGSDIGDINNDGYKEIFSTDMLPADNQRIKTMTKFDEFSTGSIKYKSNFHHQYIQNGLHLNNGDNTFSEISFMAGTAATDWSWGALMFDFQNDGWKDLLVCNGIYRDITDLDFVDFLADKSNVKKIVNEKGKFDFRDFLPFLPVTRMSKYAFINQKNLTFKNSAYELGLGEPTFSNGAAYGDLDNDGDLDLIVNNENLECSVYRNNCREQAAGSKGQEVNYLKVKLKGEGKNLFGVGAEVRIFSQEQQQTHQLMPSRGFESSVEPVLHFGLGGFTKIDSLVVIWADLKMQIFKNIPVNQTLTLSQADAKLKFVSKRQFVKTLYEDISASSLSGNTRHTENLFVDFDRERLLPRMLSTQSPRLAKGDVNGDGLEDFFMGGAKNDAGKIFLQTPAGQFKQMPQPDLEEDKNFEDAGTAFLDFDRDKDLDLLVAAGSYEEEAPVRLYLNDGKGVFKASPEKSPKIQVNASCVVVCDFDKDGDEDVFVGGRAVPGNYGLNPKSYLLKNENGNFQDITPAGLSKIGMVTDAVWTDTDQDGFQDLVVVGEWMPIAIFKNEKGQVGNQKSEIPNSSGWWNVIETTDLDDDGDMDFIGGSWGLNFKLKATPEKPLQLFVKDFDESGTTDCLITTFANDGKSYPFASKFDLTAQMPILKKQNLKYKDYAEKTYPELFTEEQRKNALEKWVETFETSVFINQGQGKFEKVTLPFQAQLSPIFGILAEDLDGDGKKDIFLAGNFYDLKPEIGRLDANYGVLLKGNGKNNFTFVPNQYSGITLNGQVRDLMSFTNKQGRKAILFSRNNDKILLFRQK